MSSPQFFGRHLSIELERLGIPTAKLEALAKRLSLGESALTAIRSGRWGELPYNALFLIASFVGDAAFGEIVRVVESPIWGAFRSPERRGLVVVGRNKSGKRIKSDLECAVQLETATGLEVEDATLVGTDEQIRALVDRNNVISVGGSKVNFATELILQRLNEVPAGVRIRFEWPGYSRETPVSGASPSNQRRLIVNGGILEENPDQHRYLGVVAVTRHASGADEFTNVVVAGCSRDATERMTRELWDPRFSRLYPEDWATNPARTPLVLVFDSGKTDPWSIAGYSPPRRRKPGPKGKRRGRPVH